MVARNALARKSPGIKYGISKMPACIDTAAGPGLHGSTILCDQANVTRPM
jgi:hypothetical protein